MNLENMETEQLEALGIPQEDMMDTDVEGQEAEVHMDAKRNLIEAIDGFLTLGTKEEVLTILAKF